MGEYAGYLWAGNPSPKPVYNVTAITHRDDPILPVSVAGKLVEENHTAWGVPNAAEIVYVFRQSGFPVATAWTPFESANHWYVIALANDWQTKTNLSMAKICHEIGDALFQTKAGMGTPKYIVIQDNIDITNLKVVVWAFATRNHPGSSGEIVFNDESTNPLVAYLEKSEKMSMHTTKVIYNCLPPAEFNGELPLRCSFSGAYSKELQQKVLNNWENYVFR